MPVEASLHEVFFANEWQRVWTGEHPLVVGLKRTIARMYGKQAERMRIVNLRELSDLQIESDWIPLRILEATMDDGEGVRSDDQLGVYDIGDTHTYSRRGRPDGAGAGSANEPGC